MRLDSRQREPVAVRTGRVGRNHNPLDGDRNLRHARAAQTHYYAGFILDMALDLL
jgi:hypothetical protein